MKHNFSTNAGGQTMLYVQGIDYPCGFYRDNNGVFECRSYIFKPGHGTSDPYTEMTFDAFAKDTAERILLILAEKNVREFYPHVLKNQIYRKIAEFAVTQLHRRESLHGSEAGAKIAWTLVVRDYSVTDKEFYDLDSNLLLKGPNKVSVSWAKKWIESDGNFSALVEEYKRLTKS